MCFRKWWFQKWGILVDVKVFYSTLRYWRLWRVSFLTICFESDKKKSSGVVCNHFSIFLSLDTFFDTVWKVISWPAFVSRCITDAYFSFYWLVLDIDMNRGCRLYHFFYQMDLTYAMDCLLNCITGMKIPFLLTVSPPYTQLWLSQTDKE